MAESVHLALSDNQYLCHDCGTEVSICRMEELICPLCSSEFVEELPQEQDEELDIYADLDRLDGISSVDEEIPIPFIPEMGVNNLISHMLLNVANIRELESGEVRDEEDDDDDEEDNDEDEDELEDFRSVIPPLLNRLPHPPIEELYEATSGLSERSRHIIGSTMRLANYLNIDGLDEDLDLLASQLLDEIDLSGPGPLKKEQIKQLKTVTISQEQVDLGLQCTVCMEDFIINEETKSLKCGHIYHEKCLEPWLQRQATCPNCRKTVEAQTSKCSQSSSPQPPHAENESQRNEESSSSSRFDFPSQRERYRQIFL